MNTNTINDSTKISMRIKSIAITSWNQKNLLEKELISSTHKRGNLERFEMIPRRSFRAWETETRDGRGER